VSGSTANGSRSTVDVPIEIAGALKIGNFRLSFQDLALPMAGIPIAVTRTYDTLDAGKMGDFGYGWSLDGLNIELTTDAATSGGSGGGENVLGLPPAFSDGTRVFVKLPDGTRHTFQFYGMPLDPPPGSGAAGRSAAGLLFNAGIARPGFCPDALDIDSACYDAGAPAQLEVDRSLTITRQEDGSYNDAVGMPYNPASDYLNSIYTLTLRDGTVFRIDGKSGAMIDVTDPRGHTLEVTKRCYSGG
jgi:hypothetical protein